MNRWSIRWCVAASLALLASLVLSAPVLDTSLVAEASAEGLVEVPPLGVSGTPKGEMPRAEPVQTDVLVEPPTEALPVQESWNTRLQREKAQAPAPEVQGFDEVFSEEDASSRTEFGNTYENVDGTRTTVIDNHVVNYSVDGEWRPIDPRVIPTKAGTWVTKASDQVLTFSSKSIAVASRGEVVSWVPAGVSLPEPVVSEDGLTVTYLQVWPGVDLRYRLATDMVTEEIVISDAESVPKDGSFAFAVTGPGLNLAEDGTVRFEGDLADRLVLGGVEVFNADGLPISDPKDVSLTVGKRREVSNGVVDDLSVAVDPEWASALPDDAFPLVVDPMLVMTSPWIRNATSNAGGTCSTNPICDTARVGNVYTTVNRFWHTSVSFDYSAYLPTSTVASQLTAASLYMAYVSGDTAYRPIAVRHATGYGYCGVFYNNDCAQATTPYLTPLQTMATGSVNYDVMSFVNPYWSVGQATVAFALSSAENAGQNSYKRISTKLTLTYNRLPIPQPAGMSPGNPYTFHSSADGVNLSIPQLTDPDGAEALYYRFMVCGNSTCTSTVWDDSGWASIGVPDADPWHYDTGIWGPGPGLAANWYNQQLYWRVMVSNSSTGAGLIAYSQSNAWMLVNGCPATPAMSDPAGGSGQFTWAPNQTPTLTVTPYADPDGDWASYRVVVRKKGGGENVYVSPWSTLTASLSPINFQVPPYSGMEAGDYEWTAEAQDYTTYFHWYFYQGAPCSAASSFRSAAFEARLGSGGPSPTQALGPVSVNLATGNVTTAISMPQISTLGGSMGASLTYNSRADDVGLRAQLYNDANNNGTVDSGEWSSSRVDRELRFQWSTPSALPGIAHLYGTWTGYLTVPAAGTYHLAAAVGADEKVEVKVGTGYTLQVNYTSPAEIKIDYPTGLNPTSYNAFSNVTVTGTLTTTTAWQVLPITITYRNPTGAGHFALYLWDSAVSNFGAMPTSWLSPTMQVLPRGWAFNHLEGSGASYTSARVEAASIVLTRADGSTVSYTKNASGGYTPPAGEDDVVSYAAGKVTVTDTAGSVHQFKEDGLLATVTAAAATKTAAAAPTLGWSSFTPTGFTVATERLTSLTDPVSGRQVTFKYQGVNSFGCDTTGFASVPPGMLCQINYPDTSATKLFYSSDGQGSVQLSRVRNPGNSTLGYPTVDFGYQQVDMKGGAYTLPMLSSIRDPLVNDAIAFGQITASDDYLTQIVYEDFATSGSNRDGRVTSVIAPKPSATGFRQQVDVEYVMSGGVTFNETWLHVLGLDNVVSLTDWDRRVEFDSAARTTREYQAWNATSVNSIITEYEWDGSTPDDRLLSVKASKQKTSYFYSPEGWLTDTYGPANESCFTGNMPASCTPAVPHSSTVYDGGFTGLAVSVWPNRYFEGAPSNIVTGLAGATSLSYNWGSGGPAEATTAGGGQLTNEFAMRLTGSITFPTTGYFTFTTAADDSLVLYVDDQLVASGGSFIVGTETSLTRRIQIAFVETIDNASFSVNWSGPGITGTVAVPISALKPRYGLVTSSTVDDSGGVTPSMTSTTSYSAVDPAYGLPTSVTSAGLTTTTTYETSGYRRPTLRTLPAGNQTEYQYYGASDTADDPCTAGTNNVNQGGRLQYTIDPIAQTGKQIITQQIYDVLSRPVASKRGIKTSGGTTWESTWACVTYDARNRPTVVTVPNNAGTATERTITTNYAVSGDPRKTSVTDSAGTISSEADLLGRGVSYTDVWGTVTTSSYDATGEPGRLGETVVTTSTAVVAATHAWDYDRAGRLTQQYLDGDTIAIPTYNAAGTANEHTLASVSYPSGSGNAGNDTSLAAITRNTNGAVIETTWNQSTSAFFTNTVARSQTGRIITDSVNGGSTSSFVYDSAGRLSQATQPGHVLQYQYGTTACGGTNPLNNAGSNSNRTTLVDNSVTTASYCYDTADRLVSTTAAGYGGGIAYDDHGNTTTLAGETLAYDGADRHVSTTANGVTVTYTRDATDRIVARTIPAPDTTPVFRDAGTAANNAGGSTSLALNRPTAAVAGDLLLATVATVGATVTAPAAWTTITTTSNTGVASTLFWRIAAGGDPTSWTFTLSTSQKATGQIVAYSGTHATYPIDTVGSTATASGTTHTAPVVTTTEDNRLILTVAAIAIDTTWTPAAGTNERVDTAATNGSPSVTVHLAEHNQTTEGLSSVLTPTATSAAVGATMTIALRPSNSTIATKTLRYSYSGGADSTALTMTSANAILDRTCSVPGGVTVTGLPGGPSTWAYPNIHGDVTYTVNQTDTISGPYLYDPFGQALTNEANTSPGDFDNQWLGQHQRPTEHQPELKQTIEMGARPYRADLGRFLRVDPIDGGATFSDFSYVSDPINAFDLSGMCNSSAAWCVIGILTGNEDLPTIEIKGKTFTQWMWERGGDIFYRKKTKAGARTLRADGGCSAPVSSSFNFDFNNACKTHDLGYDLMRWFNSTGALGSTRMAVDALLLNDMRADCSGRGWFGVYESSCKAVADIFYAAVTINSLRQGYTTP